MGIGCGPIDRDSNNQNGGGSKETPTYPGFCTCEIQKDEDEAIEGLEEATYNDQDQLILLVWDSGPDDDADEITYIDYNSEGQLVMEKVDRFGEGNIDRTQSYEYNDDGRLTAEKWDDNADGVPDITIEYKHDEHGNPVIGTGDSDGDGEVDVRIEKQWKDGLLTAYALDGLHAEPDKTPDRVVRYYYDNSGNLIEGHFDYDANGKPDVRASYNYDCWDE